MNRPNRDAAAAARVLEKLKADKTRNCCGGATRNYDATPGYSTPDSWSAAYQLAEFRFSEAVMSKVSVKIKSNIFGPTR
jgi:hypothetical protein